MWPYSGRPIVPATGRNRFIMESVDGCPVRRHKGDMGAGLKDSRDPIQKNALGAMP